MARVVFNGDADFRSVTFRGKTQIVATTFAKRANFFDTIFEGKADFIGVQFEQLASFERAKFGASVTFDNFVDSAAAAALAPTVAEREDSRAGLIESSHLVRTAADRIGFRDAVFTGFASVNISVKGEAWFTDARFSRARMFITAHEVAFDGAHFAEGAVLYLESAQASLVGVTFDGRAGVGSRRPRRRQRNLRH